MNSECFRSPDAKDSSATRWLILGDWWPILIGLLVLYAPTYLDLSRTLWAKEENAHGPVVLVAVLWLLWRQRSIFLSPPRRILSSLGSLLFAVGLALYVIGRSQEILVFEVGSQIPVLIGVLLISHGVASVRAFWFPLMFLLFVIPLPGLIVDAVTGPLKQQISAFAENMVYLAGYPIARSGVVLTVGPYELLVADACSGLHSIWSLSAMGLLYLYLSHDGNWLRNGLLICAIVPIALAANVVRIILLVLITYHFGDDVGQGFAHDFAGIVLFLVALLFLFSLDGILGAFLTTKRQSV